MLSLLGLCARRQCVGRLLLGQLAAAAVAALLVGGAALKREARVELVMSQRGVGKDSSLQESIYEDETL